MVLDLALRLRVHALASWLAEADVRGVVDLTPGIRSLQIQVDPDVLSRRTAHDDPRGGRRRVAVDDGARGAEPRDPPAVVVGRPVHTRGDRPATWPRSATTRPGARGTSSSSAASTAWPPCDDVHRIVFDAAYLVLGLGDVYLGAPVATPLDPRHRLVTTKYNPARTWTPGERGRHRRRLPLHLRHGRTRAAISSSGARCRCGTASARPALRAGPALAAALLRSHPLVSRSRPTSCSELRADLRAGRMPLRIDDGTFSLADLRAPSSIHTPPSIAAFQDQQQAAFGAERGRLGGGRASSIPASEEVFEPVPVADLDAPARRHGRRGRAHRQRVAGATSSRARRSPPERGSSRSRR